MTVLDTVSTGGTRTGNKAAVCPADALEPNLGACVLLPDGRQVALFKVVDSDTGIDRIYALSNIDPYMDAAVMSRGLVGEHHGEPTVASPLLKQVFRLVDGASLEDDGVVLDVFAVEIRDGEVVIGY